MRVILAAALVLAAPSFAQTVESDDEFDTGLGAIVVQPLDDTIGFDNSTIGEGVGTGLSLEDLQSIPDDGGFQRDLRDVTTETQEKVASAASATIRVLDKLTGRSADLTLTRGTPQSWGYLTAELRDCRYPEGNPAGDAYTYLTIRVENMDEPAFEGWMIASSPALNAMDHARYDVWPLACNTS
ncbi:DUF2155 domain-containing protein [Celeribacter sp.]|uniref:DUF2155 domain-containing protein n=1 Tax=Celeribacter sp. TaxID=1890673 RepID=UPI003A903BEE